MNFHASLLSGKRILLTEMTGRNRKATQTASVSQGDFQGALTSQRSRTPSDKNRETNGRNKAQASPSFLVCLLTEMIGKDIVSH